ncbi:MAG TPA: hypothetical protein VKK79_18340, partial [Candidatus Lokiarchaeia archaeon]|nr:hypothetical protein [Candidatus Lokiarchaeia archaeon]
KKKIPPFRLIQRARYDCLEAFGDEKVAKQRLADLVALGVKKQNVEIVTIVRGKFKGQAPYNKKGECFAIYVRKTLD